MEELNVDIDNISDTSSEDDVESYDPIYYGYKLSVSHCGSSIIYHTWYTALTSGDILQPISKDIYINLLIHLIDAYRDSMRNLVLMIKYRYKRSYISITRRRLLSIDVDMVRALSVILNSLLMCNYRDIYEVYDANYNVFNYRYPDDDIDMSMFTLDYSYFAIAFANKPAGGSVTSTIFYDHVVVIDAPNIYGSNNCLFNCITYVVNKSIDVPKIRSLRRFSNGANIRVKDLKYIEKILNISLTIYCDDVDDSNKPVIIYQSWNNGINNVYLVLHDRHYTVYHSIRPDNKEVSRLLSNDTTTYIFYDMETYFDTNDHYQAVPYCFSYIIITNGMPLSQGCIIKDKIEDNISSNIAHILMPHIDSGNTRIIGFNNGAFDDYILIDILSRYDRHLTKAIFDKRNRIIFFSYNKITSKDLYRFVLTSLRKATLSFKCNDQKLYFDHNIIQTSVNNKTYNNIMDANMLDMITKYAMFDVLALKSLYFTLIDTFKYINKFFDIDNPNIITLPQMSMKGFLHYLKDFYVDQNYKVKLPIDRDYSSDMAMRKALIGGRCQVFEKGEHDNISILDANSLYPHIMANNRYPILLSNKITKEIVRGKFYQCTGYAGDGRNGIYYVTIITQPDDKIVPQTNIDGTHDWNYNGEITRWITSTTLRLLIRYKCKIYVHYGYVLDAIEEYIFRDFLSPIIYMKEEQDAYRTTGNNRYNPALRECLKLIMNSLSGKMLESPITTNKILTSVQSKCDEMISKYGTMIEVQLMYNKLWLLTGYNTDDNIKVKSPIIIGMMILDQAKEYMYEIINKITRKYYMDTDSIIMDTTELTKLSHIIGSKTGQLKLELQSTDNRQYKAIIASKKCYCIYYTEENKEIILDDWFKIKGVNVRGEHHDKIIPYEDITYVQTIARDNNYKILADKYNTYKTAKSLDLIRKIMRNNYVYVLCFHMQRKTNNEDFGIYGTYIIKKLPLEQVDSI